MRAAFIVLIAAVVVLWHGVTDAEVDDDIVVIVNKGNSVDVLTQEELRLLFQTTRLHWPDGVKAEPLNLGDEDRLRRSFDQAVLGLDPERVTRYWIDRKIRGGEHPPRRIASTMAAVRTVSSSRGSIAYVRRSDLAPTVKVVAKIRNGAVVQP